MNSILVPFDFSHNSRNALRYAAELAKLAKARLTVLHAYDRAAILEGISPKGTQEGMEKERHHLVKHYGLPETVMLWRRHSHRLPAVAASEAVGPRSK